MRFPLSLSRFHARARTLAALAACVAGGGPALLAAAPPPAIAAGDAASLADSARVRRWREDVGYVVDQVQRIHPRPFAFRPRADFDSAASSIERRVPTLEDYQIAVELARMVAMLGDGHTMLIATTPGTGFTSVIPLALRPFEDGLYVAAAAREHARLLGARVTAIGGLPAAAALERVLALVGGDNRYGRLDRASLFLMSPLALRALGVGSERDRLTLDLELAGRSERVTIAAGAPPPGFPDVFLESEPVYPAGWVSARDSTRAAPLCDRHPEQAWWWEYLPEHRQLYLRMRRVEPVSGDLTFGKFLRRFFAATDSLRPAALVVDLRHDHGGNNLLVDELVHGIVARPWLDRDGAFFTLIDRGTFSAAMNTAVFFESQTRTVFAGEPTAGRPNHYGDARHMSLPNSGLPLMVSAWPWAARVPWDDREWIAPAIAVPSRFADWRANRDPVLEAVTDAMVHGTLTRRVRAAADSGAGAATAAFTAWRERYPDRWGHSAESELAALGDELIEEGSIAAALAVCEARTAAFPKSSGAWRQQGEACLEAGDRTRAVASLREALRLNPDSRAARFMLQRLGEKP